MMLNLLSLIKALYKRRQKGMSIKERDWFSTTNFDLFIWYDEEENVEGFQICYDKNLQEKALTWKQKVGFSHSIVDSGEESPKKNMTPILIDNRNYNKQYIISEFHKESKIMNISFHLFSLISAKLEQL